MVDQRRIDDQRWVDSRTAARHLGIQQRTLYAYVSRGQVRSVAGENGRPRLYALADLERLRARRDARAGHGAVAAGALRWGEPVLDSAITAITPRGPAYRGHLAIDLAGGTATDAASRRASDLAGGSASGAAMRRASDLAGGSESDAASRRAPDLAGGSASGAAMRRASDLAVGSESAAARDRAGRSTRDRAEVSAVVAAGSDARDVAPRANDFAFASAAPTPFENVAELLWSGYLPTDAVLWPRAAIPLGQLARLVPYGARPLDVMPLVLSVASLADPQRTDGRPDTLIARGRMLIPLLAACLAPELSAATVTRALTARSVANIAARALGLDDDDTPIIDTILVLLADHELNASSFAARVAASTGADPYACIAAALATVSGPLHGSASESLAHFTDGIGSPEAVPAALAALRKRGESPPAFGHPLYPAGDPRTLPMLALARELTGASPRSPRDSAHRSSSTRDSESTTRNPESTTRDSESTTRCDGLRRARTLLAIVDAVAAHAARSRVSTKRTSDPAPTPAAALPSVDVGLAALTAALGLPPSSASGLFALARSAGWLAHALEQRAAGFLLRPRARYVGIPVGA